MKNAGSILAVDDNPENLRFLHVLLKEQGYQARTTLYGEMALKAACRKPPDLILLDIMMTGMDGYEVCEKLKADDRTRDIPVIFISALDEMPDRVKAFSLGGVDFIIKPFVKEDLLARVSTHLRIRSLQQDLYKRNTELVREIAERKRAEDDLHKAKEALETANIGLERRVLDELEKRQRQQMLLIQKSKLESLGKLAAGIAHEINQPLSAISMGLDNIIFSVSSDSASVDETTAAYLRKETGHLFEDVERIDHIIKHIKTFSREQESVVLEPVDVNEVCVNALSMIKTRYKNHDVEIVWKPGENIRSVTGNKYKLEQVVLNLLSNAGDAVEEKQAGSENMPYNKQIEIRTFCDGNRVCLEVWDNGAGIPEDILENIFDPFFTTKPLESGSGLGLSISYGIVREMGGDIGVESEQGDHTVMRVLLPGIENGKTENTDCR